MRPAVRPVPASLQMVAFPSALHPPEPVPLVVSAPAAAVTLPDRSPDWLHLRHPRDLAPGLCRVDCHPSDNPRATRRARLAISVSGRPWEVEFIQQPGLLLQTEQIRLLNAPLNLDMLILVSWVADLINDLEFPPLQAIVTVLAVLALLALGLMLALLRRLFAAVPEPCPLSNDTLGQSVIIVPGVAVSGLLPSLLLPAEDQVIGLQTVKSIYWLLRQLR
ncbi:MAG: hypothetical protein EKK52_01285 [Burkholderiales bacterium]|jgi:hypothetical protein|nr:MAG: hypothetical protein EKK52_01285 [Burkholderiales bacterium]